MELLHGRHNKPTQKRKKRHIDRAAGPLTWILNDLTSRRNLRWHGLRGHDHRNDHFRRERGGWQRRCVRSLGGGAEKKHRGVYLLTRVATIVSFVRLCLSSTDSCFYPLPFPIPLLRHLARRLENGTFLNSVVPSTSNDDVIVLSRQSIFFDQTFSIVMLVRGNLCWGGDRGRYLGKHFLRWQLFRPQRR